MLHQKAKLKEPNKLRRSAGEEEADSRQLDRQTVAGRDGGVGGVAT